MKFLILVISSICFLNIQFVSAEVLSVDVQPGDQLKIKVFSGKIKLSQSPGQKLSLSFKGKNSFFSDKLKLSKNKGVIEIKGNGDIKSSESLEIEVKGPSLPTQMFWGEGEVRVKSWASPLFISQNGGQLFLESQKSSTRLNLNKVNATIKSHKGELSIDSYKGSVNLNGQTGALYIESFVGTLNLDRVTGKAEVSLYKGKMKAQRTKGDLEFVGKRTHLNLKSHRGAIKAQLGQGSLSAEILGRPSVHVRSEEAGVNLKLAKTGAKVNIGTVKAYLTIPQSLSRARLPNMVVARGNLLGSGGGQIYVRTESGNIKLH